MPVINGTIGKDNPLRGTVGNDSIYGFAGDDQIITNDGDDYVEAGDGDDEVNGYPTTGTSYSFYASTGSKTFYGGNGNDFLFGSSGINLIYGDSGNDKIYGQDANDKLFGGEGNDTIYGGAGIDTLDGGNGDDFLTKYKETGVGNFVGGNGNDSIIGSLGNDTIDGGAGDDPRLDGDTGDDVIFGGHGNDEIYGDLGNDTLNGGLGNDTLYGGSGNDVLNGEDGDDTIWDQTDGSDTLNGGDGNDYLSTYKSSGDDKLYGGKGNDELVGGDGNDVLDGGEGVDELKGYEGNDTYYVRDAYDYIYDSAGIDTAYVYANFAKIPSSIEKVVYMDGVLALPYWIDALLPNEAAGLYFKSLLNGTTSFNYAFPLSLPTYDKNVSHADGFTAFTTEQIYRTREALSYIASLVNLQFIETSDANQTNTLIFANNNQTGSGGYAQMPNDDFTGSDVFLNKTSKTTFSLTDGQYQTLTLIHEIGHALGLEHPFSTPSASGTFADPPFLTGTEDTTKWTVMSYTDAPEQYFLRFSPLDIAALQYVYGPSKSARTGDDSYFVSNLEQNFIWDGAGTDTIDASKLTTGATIFLTPGYWGFVGSNKATLITIPGQITVNFGTSIENLVGSNYADKLSGNELGNDINGGAGDDEISGLSGDDSLNGGSGNDNLFGGEGNDKFDWNSSLRQGDDTFAGGLGDDVYVVNSKNDVVIENLNEGNDFVYVGFDYSLEKTNIENLFTFSDQKAGVTFTGNSSSNTLRGSGFNDRLNGLEGTDYLYGNDGDDQLTGGADSDYLDGGNGIDTVVLSGNFSNYYFSINRSLNSVIIKDKLTSGDGIDSLKSIEKLQFSDKTFDLLNPARTSTPTYGVTPSFLFDPAYYLLKNPELTNTVSLTTAFDNYINTGAAAGKSPNVWFDPSYYSNRWSDLKPLNLDAATLFQHYNLYGVWEGRSAGNLFDKFDGTRYLKENPDVAGYVDAYVKDFLGSRTNGAIAHYIIYGANESRSAYDSTGKVIEQTIIIGTPT